MKTLTAQGSFVPSYYAHIVLRALSLTGGGLDVDASSFENLCGVLLGGVRGMAVGKGSLVASCKTATSTSTSTASSATTTGATYNKLSTILSDMARFVLTHRFGGIYLDADQVLLRDWEELWGWKGAFAYRWSYHAKYNTAVLRMHKGSPLGTFLFRTALANGLDFHPMSVSQYLEEAYFQNLLFRIPDALFDSAWLNTEGYQKDRPPQPYFEK